MVERIAQACPVHYYQNCVKDYPGHFLLLSQLTIKGNRIVLMLRFVRLKRRKPIDCAVSLRVATID